MNTNHELPALEVDPTSGLSIRIHEPAGQARGLLLLSHGVGGNETNLIGLLPLLPQDLTVVFVRSALTLSASQFAWFPVQFGAEGPRIDAVQAERSRLALLALIESLQARFGLGAERTAIAGFSQGGILSASVGLTAPQMVAGFGILSGRILPELESVLAPHEALASVQGFVAHGRYDDKLPLSWAEKAEQWLSALGVPHQVRVYPMGHEIVREEVDDFRVWLDQLMP